MGRPYLFNFNTYVEFRGLLPSAPLLDQLREGMRVRLTIKEPEEFRLYRSVSTYGLEVSSTDAILVVDDINCESRFNEHGIRCLALRDVNIPREAHMYSWFLTTDGFIRECEAYGIMYEVVHIELL